jgi:hypothetical protein
MLDLHLLPKLNSWGLGCRLGLWLLWCSRVIRLLGRPRAFCLGILWQLVNLSNERSRTDRHTGRCVADQ